jgi:serine/threonine protein kinase
MRYIPPPAAVEDATKLTVYAPLAVAPTAVFKVTVYMFVKEDEAAVRDIASSGGMVHRGTGLRDFRVKRGALVSMMLYLNHAAFELADEPVYALGGSGSGADGGATDSRQRQEAGTLLRPQRLQHIRQAGEAKQRIGYAGLRKLVLRPDTPAPAGAASGCAASSSLASTPTAPGSGGAGARPRSSGSDAAADDGSGAPPGAGRRPDAMAHFAWEGRPENVVFHVRAKASRAGSAAPPLGTFPCYVRAMSGSRSVTFKFVLSVEPAASVMRKIGLGAATAARMHRAGAGGAVSSLLISSTVELGARGMRAGGKEADEGEEEALGVVTGTGRAQVLDTAASRMGGTSGVSATSVGGGGGAGDGEGYLDDTFIGEADEVKVTMEPTSKALHLAAGAVSDWHVRLARGGHGEVLLSALRQDNRVVVLKRPLLDAHSSSDSVVRAFKHEAAVQAELGHHPNLVQPLGVCLDPDNLFLALEYCPLGSLRSALDRHYGASGAPGGVAASLAAFSPHGDTPSVRRIWDLAASAVSKHVTDYSAAAKGASAASRGGDLMTSCGSMPLQAYLQRSQQALDASSSSFSLGNHAIRTQIGRDAAAGIAALHSAGFVHRDIAARNVLLSLDESPADLVFGGEGGAGMYRMGLGAKVCDVGLAVRLGVSGDADEPRDDEPSDAHASSFGGKAATGRRTSAGRESEASKLAADEIAVELDGYGTPQWLAPETLRYNLVSQSTDVYSLGCLLYELFSPTGQEPWAHVGGDRRAIYSALLDSYQASGAPGSVAAGGQRKDYGLLEHLLSAPPAASSSRREFSKAEASAGVPGRVLSVMRDCLSYDDVFEDVLAGDAETGARWGASHGKEEDADEAILRKFAEGGVLKRPSSAYVCQQLELALLEAGSVL